MHKNIEYLFGRKNMKYYYSVTKIILSLSLSPPSLSLIKIKKITWTGKYCKLSSEITNSYSPNITGSGSLSFLNPCEKKHEYEKNLIGMMYYST